MHSGFEIPTGIQPHHHRQQLPHAMIPPENTCATPVLLPPPQTNLLDSIPGPTQQLLLNQHHFLPPTHHQYIGGGGVSPAGFFPVNFKLGLNEICTGAGDIIIDKSNKDGTDGVSGCINGGEDALFRGSEQYAEPEARQSSIGMTHCWHNQQDSAIKQQPFWEPRPPEVSNENSEIEDRQENLEMRHRSESLTNCLENKNRLLFGELEAIYKRLGTSEINQTGPSESLPVTNPKLPEPGFDHWSEASIGEESASASRKKRKKKKNDSGYDRLISPMAKFFEGLVRKVMDHQENLHKKFAEVVERIDGERREREEAWRNQELAHMKQEAEARAHEKAFAATREATIVSYLEKITGQRIDLPSFISPIGNVVSNQASRIDDGFRGLEGEAHNGLKLNPQES